MRKSAKALLLVLVALVGSLGLTIAAAFSAALAFGATALIVPGTGTHNVLTDTQYRDNAANRFINPARLFTDPEGVACTSTNGCAINGVDYPAEFFPFVIFDGWCPGLSCDTWNTSVDVGVTNLDTAIDPFKNPSSTEEIYVFGYSQGGAVVSREMVDHLAALDPDVKDRITVVTIGNINNPRGLFARLGFLPTIPFLDITFGPNLPTNIVVQSVNYSFEYDPVGDAPSYWGNPLAMLNAVAAFEYVHGYYLVPNDRSAATMPYGYDDASLAAAIADEANRQTYQDATFVLIPQRGALPLFQPVLDLGNQIGLSPIVNPLVALVNPVTKLLVNLGYDRVTNPGIPQYLSILPFNLSTFNPFTFSVQFVEAIVQGVQDALNGGASLTGVGSQAPETLAGVQSFSRLAVDEGAAAGDDPTVTPDESDATTLADESDGDASAVGGDATVSGNADADAAAAAAKAAEEAAAKAAEEAAAKAAEEAAAEEAAAKKAAAQDEKEAAEEAAADKVTEAADKVRQEAADTANEVAGNKPAADSAATPAGEADADGDAAGGDKAA